MGLGYRQAIQVEEEKLLKDLSRIYRKIQRDLKVGASWNEIESIYHQRTDDIIRASVTTIYELAARRTVEKQIKVPFFLTQLDLNEIRRLSQKYQESFWLALNREINTHSTLGIKTHYDPKTLMLIKEEDTRLRNGFIGRIAESIHGEVAAVGVLSKARQVIIQRNVATSIRLLQSSATATRTGAEIKQTHFIWKTDRNTCAQCSALEGTQYLIDDPGTPIPSVDTHPRCRCELVLEDAAVEDVDEASELFF